MRPFRLCSLWCLAGFACALLALVPAVVRAEYDVNNRQAETIGLPGVCVGLANPTTGANYMGQGTDPISGLPVSYFSYVGVCDTGSSGNVISATETNARNLPTTGQTYQDVGIGGTEIFNVSQPTTLKLAPMSVGWNGSEVISNYTSYGNYKFELRQTDPTIGYPGYPGLSYPVETNTIGTPVLNQFVMHVQPGYIPITNGDFFPTMDYMQTTFSSQSSLPSSLNASPSQLVLVPANGSASNALHVPLVYQNFVTANPTVTTATNPTIPGVEVVDHREPAGSTPPTSNWLLDTGSSVTMVGQNLAAQIGINTATETPAATVQVIGIGSSGTLTFNGYMVDKLVIPLAGGNTLAFNNVVVFVPSAGALPANLPGILGMNLLGESFSGEDPITGTLLNPTNSWFSDFYVVPPSSLPGDANGDGTVDVNDLTIVLSNFGQTGMTWSQGEFTGSGTVDVNDLTIVLTNFGQTAAASGMASVPEPSTVALLAAAVLALLACAESPEITRHPPSPLAPN